MISANTSHWHCLTNSGQVCWGQSHIRCLTCNAHYAQSKSNRFIRICSDCYKTVGTYEYESGKTSDKVLPWKFSYQFKITTGEKLTIFTKDLEHNKIYGLNCAKLVKYTSTTIKDF